MPNWCWNNLNITGDEKELQDFVEKSTTQEDKDFSFNGTFPMNDDLDISAGTHNTNQEEQRVLNKGLYGHSNWYDWRICEWGTKWDADEAEIIHNLKVQEDNAYLDRKIAELRQSLALIKKAVKGLVVMSNDLEAMGNNMFNGAVPGMWMAAAYPSRMPLGRTRQC